jgi:poly-gamma-glutamate synthesis protein (capsule biosynthesis protein)
LNEVISLILSLISLSTSASCDLDSDGKGDFSHIEDHKAIVEINGQKIFESPPELKVVEIFCEDIDLDGQNEIALSLWKHGRFGNSLPFWIKENEDTYKMHLFLYKYKNGTLKPYWHSSDLARQNLKLIPIKGGFIAIERLYDSLTFSISFPVWKNFGFEILKQYNLF